MLSSPVHNASQEVIPAIHFIGNDAPEDMLAPTDSPLRRYAVLSTEPPDAFVDARAAGADDPEALTYTPGEWERAVLARCRGALGRAAVAVQAMVVSPRADDGPHAFLH